MDATTSQITSLAIVYSTDYSGADQRKHQSFASLAFVRGIHRGPVNSPLKWPVTRKMFPFDDVIMCPSSLSWSIRPIWIALLPTIHPGYRVFWCQTTVSEGRPKLDGKWYSCQGRQHREEFFYWTIICVWVSNKFCLFSSILCLRPTKLWLCNLSAIHLKYPVICLKWFD